MKLEKVVDNRQTGDWRKNFWHVLDELNPRWEYIFRFGTEIKNVEAHSMIGIISYMLDDCYFDADYQSTKRMMLFNFVSTKIFEYYSNINQRATITNDDEIVIELDGKSDYIINIDISSDRKFLSSLLNANLIKIYERSDVFNLSTKRNDHCSDCLKCLLYSCDKDGVYCKADMRNVDYNSEYARSCEEYLPFCSTKRNTYHEVKSIII